MPRFASSKNECLLLPIARTNKFGILSRLERLNKLCNNAIGALRGERKVTTYSYLPLTSPYYTCFILVNLTLTRGNPQALKAHSLTLVGTSASIEEALQLARQLSAKSPPIDSTECLRLLTRVWGGVGAEHLPEVSKLWERAIKANPKNEILAREWLWGTVRSLDWRGAQKAAMSLQKNFPTKREYWFWAVVTCLLLHVCSPLLISLSQNPVIDGVGRIRCQNRHRIGSSTGCWHIR